MDDPILTYTTKTSGGGSFNKTSDLMEYLASGLLKFNYKFGKDISFYSNEELSGDALIYAREVIYSELKLLVQDYHIDGEPNGFGRSALKITILGKDRILNHFKNKIDQRIYDLQHLVTFLDEVISKNETIYFYGHGNMDTLDTYIVWNCKHLAKSTGTCEISVLENKVFYIFKTDNLIERNPNIFNDRVEKLIKTGYLIRTKNLLKVTEKGQVVEVTRNFITKTVRIEENACQ